MTTQLETIAPGTPGSTETTLARAEAFRVAMLEAGILLPPFVITDARLCLATSEDDIDETFAAAAWALKPLA